MRRENLSAFIFVGIFLGFVVLLALAGWATWFFLSSHRSILDRHAATSVTRPSFGTSSAHR
jgi:hypothetical protein